MSIKLTQYSHGAGCGCKIAPAMLDTMLKSSLNMPVDKKLLVGNQSRDDAAVYDLGDGSAVISTTDFFMPIADDPFDFGRIAAANAISDVYAMGGQPLLAIAILGWPIDKLAPEVAQQVIDGGRSICAEAGIVLAGGHSIDSPEPIFGLAVTGRVQIEQLKRNDTASEGDLLYLTKPLGIGILTTAQKRGIVKLKDHELAIDTMCRLNSIGRDLAKVAGVTAMTDVTGFGLLGHLTEVCQGAGLQAELWPERVPTLPNVEHYMEQGAVPGGSERNFASYGSKVAELTDSQRILLCDPQTSGGLLIAVKPTQRAEVEALLLEHGYAHSPIGRLQRKAGPKLIELGGVADGC